MMGSMENRSTNWNLSPASAYQRSGGRAMGKKNARDEHGREVGGGNEKKNQDFENRPAAEATLAGAAACDQRACSLTE